MKLSLQFNNLSFNTQCLSSATSKKRSPSRPIPVTNALEQSSLKVDNQQLLPLELSLLQRRITQLSRKSVWQHSSLVKDLINTQQAERRYLQKQITNLLNPLSRSISFQQLAVFKGCFSGCTIHSVSRRCSWMITYVEQRSMKPLSQKNNFKTCFL